MVRLILASLLCFPAYGLSGFAAAAEPEAADEAAEDSKSKDAKESSDDDNKSGGNTKKTDEKKSAEADDDDSTDAPKEKTKESKPESDDADDVEKNPEPKKRDVHVVKAKDLAIEAESDGVFVAADSEEVALRPEVWSSFKIVEVVPHGARVRKGDVLVEFDDRDIKESLEEKSLQQRIGEVALLEAEEELPRLEKSTALRLETAQRDYEQAVDEYKRFKETMRPLSEEYADYDLKSAEKDLENAEEELDQLQTMYEADELTEETEEIVLKQHKFRVELAKFWVKYGAINHDYTKKVSLPERDEELKSATEETEIELERAKMAKSLGLSEKRYELESLREARAKNVERHAELVEDKALMKLRAPMDGVVYYGRCINGRWSEVSAYESKLIPFASVPPNSVLMTVVAERPLRFETSVGEKDVTSVKPEQEATIVPAADQEVEIDASVDEVEAIPGGGNQFTVRLDLEGGDLPDWIKPGMTAKAKITTYETDDAIVIPADLLQTDEDKPKVRYVMVEEEKGEDPVRHDLKLGKKKGKDVEILKGLEAGDRIVKGAKDDVDEEEEDDDNEDDE